MNLTRQQAGDFAATFLDMLDEIEHPIIAAAFVAVVRNSDNTEGLVTRTTRPHALPNITMFQQAAVLEHVMLTKAAERAIAEAQGHNHEPEED